MLRPRYDLTASGEKMKRIRMNKGITVRQVMDYLGLTSMQAIYKWESGNCYPQADNLLALAKLYQVSPFELMAEEVPRQ